jgi:hypothetical protein
VVTAAHCVYDINESHQYVSALNFVAGQNGNLQPFGQAAWATLRVVDQFTQQARVPKPPPLQLAISVHGSLPLCLVAPCQVPVGKAGTIPAKRPAVSCLPDAACDAFLRRCCSHVPCSQAAHSSGVMRRDHC